MIAGIFLPLADFKTITVETPAESAQSTLGIEIAGVAALLVLLLVLMLASRLWRRNPPLPKSAPENWVLIDGSNVMHWQDSTPRLEAVQKVVDQLRRLGYVPGVVFDANAGWKLAGRYLHDGDFARLLGIDPSQVLVVPKGSQADPFLLQTAREFDTSIVTNDRFRDWAQQHPEVAKPGFLIRGEIQGNEVRLNGLAQQSSDATKTARAS